MKIVMINAVPYGSPAKIMYGIAECATNSGFSVQTATGYSNHPAPETPKSNITVSSAISKYLHMKFAKITGMEGYFSILNTIAFIRKLKVIKPDIIHLHNLHGWYINLPMLFRYINDNGINVVWTLHDCWAFTGHCAYFDMIHCEKWKNGCHNCMQYRDYPMTKFDNSKRMYKAKKRMFTSIKTITIVTPSNWLSKLVKTSFLQNNEVRVINNGIDLNIYKPTASDFRKQNNAINLKIILGVASPWSKRKGLDDFIQLAKSLSDQYKIVLVGTDDKLDMKLPSNIISIHRTQNQNELAQIYSMADVFVNPTYEDNFPTVNLEALACGTPVITYNTGGSIEVVDETCGMVVEQGNIDALKIAIESICESEKITRENCVKKSLNFSKDDKLIEYVELYKQILERK